MNELEWELCQEAESGEEKQKAGRIRAGEKASFFSLLAKLLRGGVPAQKAMDLIAKQGGKKFGFVLILKHSVEEGLAFSEAMEAAGGFSLLEVSLVRAGEAAGELETALERLSGEIQKAREIRGRVREAFTYPLFVASLGAVTFAVLLTWVIPRLASVYQNFGAELPGLTRAVIACSSFCRKFFIVGIFLICLTAGALVWKKEKLSVWLEKIPLMGDLLREARLIRFPFLLALLLKSGIPLLRALEVIEDALSSSTREELERAREQVSQGEELSGALREVNWIGEPVCALIAAAEASGTLPETLEEISRDAGEELERRTHWMLKLLEPSMIVLIGGVTGILVIAMLLPIINLSAVIQ